MNFLTNKFDWFFLSTIPGGLGAATIYTNQDKIYSWTIKNGQIKDEGVDISISPKKPMWKLNTKYNRPRWTEERINETTEALLAPPISFEFNKTQLQRSADSGASKKSITFKWKLAPTGDNWTQEEMNINTKSGSYKVTLHYNTNSQECRYNFEETESKFQSKDSSNDAHTSEALNLIYSDINGKCKSSAKGVEVK